MRNKISIIRPELKMDLYFATTFGFLIPIIYPPINSFNSSFNFIFTMDIILIVLLTSLYIVSNMVFFKESRIRNTISNCVGIVSYSFLAVPIYNIVNAKFDFTKINMLGAVLSISICLILKFIKLYLDKKR